jgi:hypothetical protein
MIVSHLLHGEDVKPQTTSQSPASGHATDRKKAQPTAQGCRADAAGVYDVYSGTFWSSMVDIMPN